ncbi:MAG: PAS domain S-box protein [Bacteroidales bacterium]|nr:PAS domain S-box protein [Bacteroidales bacterium]
MNNINSPGRYSSFLQDNTLKIMDKAGFAISYQKMLFNEKHIPVDIEFIDANSAFEQLSGSSHENLIGQNLSKITKGNNQQVYQLLGFINEAIKDRPSIQLDFYVKESEQWLNITITGFSNNEFAAIIQDLSVRHNQGEISLGNMQLFNQIENSKDDRFRKLVENSTIGLYRTSPDGKILMANPALIRLMGFKSFEQLSQRNLEKEGFEPSYSRKQFKKKLEENGEVRGLEAIWKKRDGSWIEVRENARTVRSNDGTVLYYEGTVEDITEKKAAERQLKKLNNIFYELGTDPFENMHLIVRKTNEILGGVASLYNRLDEASKSLVAWSSHNLPKGYKKVDSPDGHICYNAVIQGDKTPVVLEELKGTKFEKTDPGVRKYGLRAYLGYPVNVYNKTIGALSIVDDKPRKFSTTEVEIITTLAKALSLEQERGENIRKRNESENALRQFIHQSKDSIVIIDEDLKISEWNIAAEQLFGLTKEQVIGKNAWEVHYKLVPEERKSQVTPNDLYHRLMSLRESKNPPPNPAEHKIQSPGKTKIVQTHEFLITTGDTTRIGSISRDITRQKEAENIIKASEEKFRRFIKEAHDGMILVDEEGKVIEWNKGEENITGYKNEEVVGRTITEAYDLLVDEQHKDHKLYGSMKRFLQGQSSPEQSNFYNQALESVIRTKNGQIRTIQAVAFPFDTGKGTRIGIVHHDISSLKEAEKYLRQAKEEAEKASDAKTRFLANMSHEIRTPLNAIIGFTDVLSSMEQDEEKYKMISTIQNSGNSLLDIINDILDLSKVEAGRLSLEKENFDVVRLISEVREHFLLLAESKDLTLDFKNNNGNELIIHQDPLRLRQVIMNLVSNAIKYTSEGSIVIYLKTVEKEDNGHFVYIAVEDTGMGIGENDLDIIFSDFYQLKHTITRSKQGTGLGLAIVKVLVDKMGGTVNVKSQPNKGSTFSFEIPYEKPVGEKQPKEASTTEADEANDEKLSLLLAEDTKSSRDLMKAFCKRQNWELDIVENGKAALEKLRERKYHLLVLDIRMPEMNGYETIKQIRAIEKESGERLPILALTAYAMESDRQHCLKLGVDEYAAKPLRYKQFTNLVTKLVKNQS